MFGAGQNYGLDKAYALIHSLSLKAAIRMEIAGKN